MSISDWGHRLSQEAGIYSLMEDLGDALNVNPNILFLGGGNPASVPAFESIVAEKLREIAANPDALHRMIGVYQSPRGDETLLDRLVSYFNAHCGWSISREHLAIANGSQSAFYVLINLLAGERPVTVAGHNDTKKILLPMTPEYLGYADQGAFKDAFIGIPPKIEEYDDNLFKYRLNALDPTFLRESSAMCVSRPTNPSGNLITDDELRALQRAARKQGIPLIVDCAYGDPFPGLNYERVEALWDDNTIYVFSLSKLGLPGARTGIVVGPPELIGHFVKINTVISLASGNFGPAILSSLLKAGQLPHICEQLLKPFYLQKREFAIDCIRKDLDGIPYKMHRAEGAFFLWLWLPDLPITSQELYQRLKLKNVLIMPGEPFFYGLHSHWKHQHECVRLSFCQSDAVIAEAVKIIGDELRSLYQ